VGLEVHGLQVDEHALRQGPPQGVRRGLPRRGPEGRLLLLAHRLAPPRLHDRPDASPAPGERRGLRASERRQGHGPLSPVHEGPGPGAALELRGDQHHLVRFLLPRQERQGPGRLGFHRPPQAGPVAAAPHPRRRPARPPGRRGGLGLHDAGTGQGRQVARDRREEDPLGDLPDLLGVVGLSPRRANLEKPGPAHRAPCRIGQQGRQPPAECRADGPRDVRRPGPGQAGGHGRMDEAQRPVRLWMHRGPRRSRRPAEHAIDVGSADPTALRPPARVSARQDRAARHGRQGQVRAVPARRLGDPLHRREGRGRREPVAEPAGPQAAGRDPRS
jgi:hypothetical protein